MATWTDIANSAVDVSSPIDEALVTALRDNPVAIAEGAVGAPKVQVAAIEGLPWVVIASGSETSVAALDFIDLTTTYRTYMLVFDNILPAVNGSTLTVRTSNDNGVNFDGGASDYSFNRMGRGVNAAEDGFDTAGSVNTSINILVGLQGNAGGEMGAGRIIVYNPADSGSSTQVETFVSYRGSDGEVWAAMANGARNNTEANNAFRVAYGSSNIATMNWTFYGWRAS